MIEAPQIPSEAAQQLKAKAQRLALAFQSVFGQPAKRSLAQQLVLEHLVVCAGDDANSYRFNDAKDGIALIAAGLHRDGARSILRIIDRQLSLAAKSRQDATKTKSETKR